MVGVGFVFFKCLGYFDVCEPCTPFPDLAAAVADLVVQSQSISRELKSPPQLDLSRSIIIHDRPVLAGKLDKCGSGGF